MYNETINILTNQDCWTLAHISQFKNFTNTEKQELFLKLSNFGKKLCNLMFDVLSAKKIVANEKDLQCVNGFLNWAKNLK